MLLLVGLGNPGTDYAQQRHNVGFMAVDAITRRHGFSNWRKKFQSELCEGLLGDEKVIALKPQTFMNLSGQAVAEAMRFYKLSPEDILVLHDELDLAAGKLRTKKGGGHAGHNGIRDITSHIGADFRRLRIGIGHPGEKGRVSGHVLSNFSKDDAGWLEPMLNAMADAAPLLVQKNGDNKFLTRVALLTQPDKDNTKADTSDGV